MARIRSIKPEFWDSPGTARASLRARLFFIAMWNWADDWGVGDANPKRLVGFAFPNDDDISAADYPTLRQEVSDCFDVDFYDVDGRQFYFIPSWEDHQRTEKKARRANPGPEQADRPMNTGESDSPTESVGKSATRSRIPARGKKEQGNRGTGEQGKKDMPTALEIVPDPGVTFEDFWRIWPRKDARADASRAWSKATRLHPAEEILAKAQRYVDHPNRPAAQFVPYGATWLNGRRWDDGDPVEPEIERRRPTRTEQNVDYVRELAQRMARNNAQRGKEIEQ